MMVIDPVLLKHPWKVANSNDMGLLEEEMREALNTKVEELNLDELVELIRLNESSINTAGADRSDQGWLPPQVVDVYLERLDELKRQAEKISATLGVDVLRKLGNDPNNCPSLPAELFQTFMKPHIRKIADAADAIAYGSSFEEPQLRTQQIFEYAFNRKATKKILLAKDPKDKIIEVLIYALREGFTPGVVVRRVGPNKWEKQFLEAANEFADFLLTTQVIVPHAQRYDAVDAYLLISRSPRCQTLTEMTRGKTGYYKTDLFTAFCMLGHHRITDIYKQLSHVDVNPFAHPSDFEKLSYRPSPYRPAVLEETDTQTIIEIAIGLAQAADVKSPYRNIAYALSAARAI